MDRADASSTATHLIYGCLCDGIATHALTKLGDMLAMLESDSAKGNRLLDARAGYEQLTEGRKVIIDWPFGNSL